MSSNGPFYSHSLIRLCVLNRIAETNKVYTQSEVLTLFGLDQEISTNPTDQLDYFQAKRDEIEQYIASHDLGSPIPVRALARWSLKRGSPGYDSAKMEEQILFNSVLVSVEETIQIVKDKLDYDAHPDFRIVTESSEFSSGQVEGDMIANNQSLLDVGGDMVTLNDGGEAPTFTYGNQTTLTMDDFLDRPVLISNFDWAIGSNVSIGLDVWDLFTKNPAVRSKLRNFAFLRGNLHVRVNVSASPFHYGSLMISYQPLASRNGTLNAYNTNIPIDAGFRPLFLNYLSQAAGARTINIRENRPVEVECPYMWVKPMSRLFNDGTVTIGDATSFPDIANLGALYLYSINAAKSVAAGTSSPVNVQIYAWMEDVQVSGATGTLITIATESDEFETGPVQRFASGASQIAQAVSSVPVIRPFAKASRMVFDAVGSVAALFGWARPVVVSEPVVVHPNPFQNGANVIGSETNKRVTLDPKQEITVDPSVLGVTHDDMVISDIASRESYFYTFNWDPSDTPFSTILVQFGVCPLANNQFSRLGTNYIQPTALAYAAMPFEYWHGTIQYRFEIICSAYHRGKIAIGFDPNANSLSTMTLDVNKQFYKVVDIQETQSFTVCVNWANAYPWATMGTSNSFAIWSPGGFHTNSVNGVLFVTPFTKIQSPDDSGVYVNVYTSCSDLMVNKLSDALLPIERRVTTESYEFWTESEEYESNERHNNPEGLTCFEMNESIFDTTHMCEHYFGERPLSFRSLLKRYATTYTDSTSSPGTSFLYFSTALPIIPNITVPYTVSPPANVQKNLFDYLRYAYVGVRGGVRKRVFGVVAYTTDSANATPNEPHAQYVRVTLRNSENTSAAIPSGVDPNSVIPSSLNGTVSYMQSTNAGVEFELPFYTSNLFVISFANDLVGTNDATAMLDTWVRRYETHFPVNLSPDGTNYNFTEDSAGAEDFGFLRFQGAPYYSVT